MTQANPTYIPALFAGVVFLFMSAGAGAQDCPAWACTSAGETRAITVPNSTGIGSRTVLEIYDPGPGRRLQLRNPGFMNNEILGYIEKGSGRITDPQRRPIGNIEGLFNK